MSQLLAAPITRRMALRGSPRPGPFHKAREVTVAREPVRLASRKADLHSCSDPVDDHAQPGRSRVPAAQASRTGRRRSTSRSGTAHVFYPEATAERCTVALLLEVDPVALVRGKGRAGDDGFALAQYVNDRPYAASSMLAVALGKVFRTAMAGRCDARPELAATALPLEIARPGAAAPRAAPSWSQRLFAPLGWTVDGDAVPLDEQFPAWGDSPLRRPAADRRAARWRTR